MSTFKKHVGRIRNTDRRCVVVYMQIPGNEENALIVDTDALPERFHDTLMTVVDSTEGQQTPHLHTLLSRRVMPDLGLDIMNALHTYGLLRVVDIDNVVMYPAPNAPCPLRTIVDFMNGEDAPKEETTELENRVLENQKSDSAQAQIDIAENILRQAQDLEDEAARKREQAYRLVPSLRPRVAPTVIASGEGNPFAEATAAPQVTASPEVTEASVTVTEDTLESPVSVTEGQEAMEATQVVPEFLDPTLPAEVQAALAAAQAEFNPEAYVDEYADADIEGNQVDTSEDAIQEFLDRAALRADKADKEKWEAMQPKNPVGRPRKDGAPAGSKAEPVPAPKKRGRPPKAKK